MSTSTGDSGTVATRGTIRLTAPDPADETDTAALPAPDVSEPDRGDAAPSTATTPDADALGLSPGLLTKILTAPSEEDRARADALNRKGLRRHRKLEIPAAIEAYRAALEAWPGHSWANYNLACAHALQGDREGALRHLRIVAALGGEEAEERLHAARTDPDFERLVDDRDFRSLTGYVTVLVAPSPSLDDGDAVAQVEAALREAHVPARARDEAWSEDLERTTLRIRAGDPAARAMADEVEVAWSRPLERRSIPDAESPLVLVLGHGARAGADVAGPKDLVGRPLVAKTDDAVERLRLKRTGFFSWERLEDDGRRVTRTGRYLLDNGALSLSYRQVMESPRRGAAPDVDIEQGRRSTHKVRVEDGALVVDDQVFQPEG
ncbi:MAG: tetratricopeptide repeat protein [Myxococcota bacterium]